MEVQHSPMPQVSRGIYGFVMLLMFVSCMVCYFLWILIPSSVTKTWMYEPPQKYWALAIPIFFCTTLFLFAFCIYPALCSLHDDRLDSLTTVRDTYSLSPKSVLESQIYEGPIRRSMKLDKESSLTKKKDTKGEKLENLRLYGSAANIHHRGRIPSAADLDISAVCKTLYIENLKS